MGNKRHTAAVFVLALLLALLPGQMLYARIGNGPTGSRIGFGLEMGYSQGLFSHHGFNILSQDGYRLREFDSGFNPSSNGYVLVSVDYEITERNVVALLGGYRGISGSDRFMTLSFRYTFLYDGTDSDGFFSCVDAGAGVSTRMDISTHLAYLTSIGEGYRFKLSPGVNMDFILSVSCAFDSPAIANPEGPGYVQKQNILSNFAGYYALNLAIALSF